MIAIVAAFCFGALGDHGIYFHDDETFRDNEALATDPGFFFSSGREHRAGRPVASLVKWWSFAAVDNQPGAAHLIVVIAHAAASVLLAWVYTRLGLSLIAGLLTGLLFLVNVAHFQAVFHISALDFPLALLFGLAAWVLRHHQDPSWRTRLAAGACLVIAISCHLSAVALLPLWVYETWRESGDWRLALRRHAASGVVVAVAAIGLLAMTPVRTTTSASLQHAGTDPLGAVAGSGRMLCWMAARLVTTAHWLPVELGDRTTVELVFGAIVLIGLVALAWRQGGQVGAAAVWTLVFLAPFALISEQLATRGREGPSHYMYLASAGASMLLAMGIQSLARRLDGRWRGRGWMLTSVCALGITGSSIWALGELLPMSLYNSGRYLFDRDPATSVQYLRRTIDAGGGVVPLHEVYLRLALALPLAGQDPYPVLQEAASRYPTSAYVQGGIAVREMESPDPRARERGAQRLQQAAELAANQGQQETFGTNIAALCHNLGVAYERVGAPERAIPLYHRALDWNPDPAASRRRLVSAYLLLVEKLAAGGDPAGAAAAGDSARAYAGSESLAF